MTATSRRGIDAALAQAREALDRLTPREAYEAARQGAVLVDIRPELNRQTEGAIPGALVIDRNVLEWRLDPTSEARLPLADYDLQVVVICNEGYASSLAAASLQGIGLHRAADLVGGYRSWRSAGLPTTLPGNRPA
jgi:rhodanese-related sulfurtransferase